MVSARSICTRGRKVGERRKRPHVHWRADGRERPATNRKVGNTMSRLAGRNPERPRGRMGYHFRHAPIPILSTDGLCR